MEIPSTAAITTRPCPGASTTRDAGETHASAWPSQRQRAHAASDGPFTKRCRRQSSQSASDGPYTTRCRRQASEVIQASDGPYTTRRRRPASKLVEPAMRRYPTRPEASKTVEPAMGRYTTRRRRHAGQSSQRWDVDGHATSTAPNANPVVRSLPARALFRSATTAAPRSVSKCTPPARVPRLGHTGGGLDGGIGGMECHGDARRPTLLTGHPACPNGGTAIDPCSISVNMGVWASSGDHCDQAGPSGPCGATCTGGRTRRPGSGVAPHSWSRPYRRASVRATRSPCGGPSQWAHQPRQRQASVQFSQSSVFKSVAVVSIAEKVLNKFLEYS